ncbi:MAG: iron-containing redox enzyme family protein [Anaerolineales bacterium]|nr:MAG: iron-containing redox enzyme family protein [Anaerolineales bacterium]
MTLQEQLNQRIEKKALLKHPFYQAWESGELPVDALRTYAREYGAFIATMPAGWETLNDAETAQEEREHAELWQDFAAGLETEVGAAELPAVSKLVADSAALFAKPATALGALYAFEAQQPDTAKSKLDGLRAHYSLPANTEPYFEVHSANHHEAAKLLTAINGLNSEEQAEALAACEQMSAALWDALTDIYDKHCAM